MELAKYQLLIKSSGDHRHCFLKPLPWASWRLYAYSYQCIKNYRVILNWNHRDYMAVSINCGGPSCGVLTIRGLVFGVYTRVPDFRKLPYRDSIRTVVILICTESFRSKQEGQAVDGFRLQIKDTHSSPEGGPGIQQGRATSFQRQSIFQFGYGIDIFNLCSYVCLRFLLYTKLVIEAFIHIASLFFRGWCCTLPTVGPTCWDPKSPTGSDQGLQHRAFHIGIKSLGKGSFKGCCRVPASRCLMFLLG